MDEQMVNLYFFMFNPYSFTAPENYSVKHIILRKKIMNRFVLLTLFVLVISCSNEYQQDSTATGKKDSIVAVPLTPVVSLRRDIVNPKPVATFSKKVPDEL